MCEKCNKEKEIKKKCKKCRMQHMKKSMIKKVPLFILNARKPGINVVGKNVHR